VEVTFASGTLDADGVVVDIGRAAEELHEVLGGLTYRNLDDDPSLAGRNTTTEVLAEVVADRIAARVAAGALEDADRRVATVTVTLRESPTAWASFERPL
jgi:6-pyruvoyl-tetrahydropterin synthase